MASYYSTPYGSNPSSGGGGAPNNNSGGYYGYGQQQPQDPSATTGAPAASQPAYANPNQWSAQPQQQQPAPAGSMMQTTQQSQQPSFFNPGMAAAVAGTMMQGGMSNPDAMIGMGGQAGKAFLESSWARAIPFLEIFMTTLRRYFAVDNRYVKRKMQRILFPFLSKVWKREQSDPVPPENKVIYSLPHSDENAPDLYIPMMSLITYVLLCAMVYGNAGQFSPEVLPEVATWCFTSQFLEVLGIRFGFYVMQAPIAFLDLFCYTGYKYLGLCLNMLFGIAGNQFGIGKEMYYILFVYTASAACFFMLKTMANNIPMVTSATGPKREVMVLGFAASQFATMYFVSKTKFLS